MEKETKKEYEAPRAEVISFENEIICIDAHLGF